MSNSRNLANLLGASAQITTDNIATSVPLGVEGYSTMSVLPLSGNNVGDQAFVQETNRLYIWNGVGWYNIALINTNPTIDSNSYDAVYTLDSSNGTSTVIQLAASDPEGIPIQWSYTASDSAQYFANITNDSSVFTITAKSNDSIWSYDSTGGTFSVTFKASDGVNLATAISEFTITFAAPMQPYGWFGGGTNPFSGVDRVDYTTDTTTAIARGPLSAARKYLAAAGNSNYGWFSGGSRPGDSSIVDRIDYADDVLTASTRGLMTISVSKHTGTGNENYSWFGSGLILSTAQSSINRIDYAADLNIASLRGPLSLARFMVAATGNSAYGWFSGGRNPETSTIDRIDYADDTTTASVRGPLSAAKSYMAGTGNENYGWVGRGPIDRIDYAIDTNVALVRGPLSVNRGGIGATGNDNYGWFGGGGPVTSGWSTVDRIDYADDTVTSSVRGPLFYSRAYLAAAGGYPG